MIHRLTALAPIALAGISLLALSAAHADDVKLPPTMIVTAYDTGTAGFNIAVARRQDDEGQIRHRCARAAGRQRRGAPGAAARQARGDLGDGLGIYFAQEGVFEFGAKEWGPQPLQVVLSSIDCNAGTLGVAKDTGVKEIKDLKGKRVGFVVGSPALNQNALAMLAFGDLKQSDVKTGRVLELRRDVEGHGQQRRRCRLRHHHHRPGQGSRDLAARHHLAADAAQRQGRLGARARKSARSSSRNRDLRRRHLARTSRSRSATTPTRSSWSTPTQPADDVYAITKAMIDELRRLQGRRAGRGRPRRQPADQELGGAAASGRRQGAQGSRVWSDEQEAHNNELFKRQQVLATAWTDYNKAKPPSDDKAFLDGWMKARAAALAKASMPNGFE